MNRAVEIEISIPQGDATVATTVRVPISDSLLDEDLRRIAHGALDLAADEFLKSARVHAATLEAGVRDRRRLRGRK